MQPYGGVVSFTPGADGCWHVIRTWKKERTVIATFWPQAGVFNDPAVAASWLTLRLQHMETEDSLLAQVDELKEIVRQLEDENERLSQFENEVLGKKLDQEFGRDTLEGDEE